MPKRVLVVEDTFQTQKILVSNLKKRGYEVVSAAIGEEGLEIAKATFPDLILLDILILGEFNGLDVLENLKKDDRLKDVPVIVLTNLDHQQEIAHRLGADDYLIKANTSLQEIMERVDYYALG